MSLLTVGATAAAFGTMLLATRYFGAGSGVAVLAAVLTLTRARRPADDSETHGWLRDLLRLPLIAALAAAVAVLLHRHIVLGAVLFTALISIATWLPSLGARGRAFGAAARLPLIAMLIAPASPHAPGGILIDLLLIVTAAWLAQLYARLAQMLAARMGFNDLPAPGPQAGDRSKPGKISGYLRMSLQMAAAVLAAFAIGYPVFAAHWSWCVLTAYIVCAGSPSRGEVVYKGLLRLLGALAGTVLAAVVQKFLAPQGADAAVAIFASLFAGVWLREYNYAFWAACMTLTMAMLQAVAGVSNGDLNLRLLAILVGALCAVAAAWLLLPLSTRSYARRVFADTLAAFDRSLQSTDQESGEELARCLTRLRRLAPVLKFHMVVARAGTESDHPALWVVRTLSCSRSISNFEGDKPKLLRAIGLTRRTLARRDGSVYEALQAVEKIARGAEE
ncbi:MAG TPA: FUSC family protein [Steroidobacteraceae bacterium]